MLTVRDLSVRYGSVEALQRISLEVGEGEAVGVVGPNGAGKSTLLRTIAGVTTPAAGEVELDGHPLLGDRPERIVRRGISFVPEGHRIIGSLTVGENLRLGATPRRDRTAAGADIESMLDLFPVLRDYRDTPAAKLSGGEQQMLAIARALVARPRLLMLDEPSLGLAPALVERVFSTLETLRADGVTILVVEQNAMMTVEFADRTYVMRSGRIELSGSRAELLENPRLEEAFMGFAPAARS